MEDFGLVFVPGGGADALDLIATCRFTYAPLITHRFALDKIDRAYELMDSRADGFVKAVLEP